MNKCITQLTRLGKEGTAETYARTLNSFTRFIGERDISFSDFDNLTALEYEAYLKSRGNLKNTSSFYMRILRAVYNRAVDDGLIPQANPFREVYTGVDKTIKRAVSLDVISRLKAMDLSAEPDHAFSRDMFVFSFITRGMSFVDMSYLKKSSLRHGYLVYCRRKTSQQLFIKWEDCMQEIVSRHPNPCTDYLLPIITHAGEERKQYKKVQHSVNYFLSILSERLGLSRPLTMYVARHSWASIARQKKVPIAAISEALGHSSETVTQIYLASLDSSVIDKANRKIIDSL